jgi:hypothetical protein
MWPFSKAGPKYIQITPILESSCPPSQEASQVCACISCPIRATCSLEKIFKTSGCEYKFITSCSRKRELTQDTSMGPVLKVGDTLCE